MNTLLLTTAVAVAASAAVAQDQDRTGWPESFTVGTASQGGTYFVWIQVESLDRPGLLMDVTRVLSDFGANIHASSSATGRDRVIKVEGCYHGHVDSLLVQAGSGVMTLAIPGSPGIPEPLASLTHVVPFNDLGALEALLGERGSEFACMIVEPIAGNMGVVPPAAGYLEGVREITASAGGVTSAPIQCDPTRNTSASDGRASPARAAAQCCLERRPGGVTTRFVAGDQVPTAARRLAGFITSARSCAPMSPICRQVT